MAVNFYLQLFHLFFTLIQLYQYIMSNYRKIADEFSRVGIKETARLNEYQLNNALDKIVQNNIDHAEFNRDVAQELFEQSQKDAGNAVLLRDYINTILTAHSVLDKHIKQFERKVDVAVDLQEKDEAVENLKQFQQDYYLLTAPFHIQAPQSSRIPNQSVSRRSDIDRSKDKSSIFADGPSNREQSGSLKIVLIIALCAFLVELLCMFVRHHFLNLLGYILVLSIFFLNYFDKYTIKATLVILGASALLDLVWVIAQANPYWNSVGQTQHSTLQPGFLKFVYILTIILLVAKVLIGILLFRFRENNDQIHKSVKFLNLRFDLDGNPESSPIAAVFTQRANIQGRNSNNIYS